jgi:hypothetical protein
MAAERDSGDNIGILKSLNDAGGKTRIILKSPVLDTSE